MAQETQNGSQTASDAVGGWRGRHHTVTCPSGQRLRIRIPGLETIMRHGDLPTAVWQIALDEVTRDDGAIGGLSERIEAAPDPEEKLKEIMAWADFQRELVRAAVVSVQGDTVNGRDGWLDVTLTDEDLGELPDVDVEMLALIVLRVRGEDARGVTIGVDPINQWTEFHKAHGLAAEACPQCEEARRALSSADMGAV